MSKALESAKKTIGAMGEMLHAITGLVARKNATDDQENTDSGSPRAKNTYAEALRKLAKEKKNAAGGADPAHAPGHRRLRPDGTSSHAGGKVQVQNESATTAQGKADRIHQSDISPRGT